MAALEAALKIWGEVDMKCFRQQAKKLTSLFIKAIEDLGLDLKLLSPKNPCYRASQVSFKTSNAYEKMQSLIDNGVIGDYREPDIMRFGFNPLFNSESDSSEAAKKLALIIKESSWKNKKYTKRNLVT